MCPRRRKRTTRRHRSRGRFAPWVFIVELIEGHAMWTGALVLFGGIVAFIYCFIVSPYATSWRGIYGDARYPEGYSIRGIDISHHQGKINWSKLRRAEIGSEPVSFVFVKATEGQSLIDENFTYNFSQARENGLIRGAYHFFVPSVSAREQARHFMRRVSLEPGDLPPVLDIETTGSLTEEQLRDSALVWLRMMEAQYGVKPILYTYYKFKKQYLDTPDFAAYPYWIAHYYVDTLHYDGVWKFWQHTDRGRLPGIKGDVDLNCYNGSMYDLKQLTIKGEDE